MTDAKKPKPRGLAAVSPERRKEIAALGGKATQAKGTGHHFDAESSKKALAKRWANYKEKQNVRAGTEGAED